MYLSFYQSNFDKSNRKVESELSTSIDFDEIVLMEKIAKGGYGTVYKATWRAAEVAVKLLNTAFEDLTDKEKEDVKSEIRLMRFYLPSYF